MPRTLRTHISFPRKRGLQISLSVSEESKLTEFLLGKRKNAPGFEWRCAGGCLLDLERAGGGHGGSIQVWAVLVALLSWKYLNLGNRPVKAWGDSSEFEGCLLNTPAAAGVQDISTTLSILKFRFCSSEYPLKKQIYSDSSPLLSLRSLSAQFNQWQLCTQTVWNVWRLWQCNFHKSLVRIMGVQDTW